ncbi:MAG: hypothetical protein Q4C56_09850, partial [Peptococcaceae bacterium]|nr:hypothetical protein [Peptococcaceae bacterium]
NDETQIWLAGQIWVFLQSATSLPPSEVFFCAQAKIHTQSCIAVCEFYTRCRKSGKTAPKSSEKRAKYTVKTQKKWQFPSKNPRKMCYTGGKAL